MLLDQLVNYLFLKGWQTFEAGIDLSMDQVEYELTTTHYEKPFLGDLHLRRILNRLLDRKSLLG